jgi:hypothetical protein
MTHGDWHSLYLWGGVWLRNPDSSPQLRTARSVTLQGYPDKVGAVWWVPVGDTLLCVNVVDVHGSHRHGYFSSDDEVGEDNAERLNQDNIY